MCAIMTPGRHQAGVQEERQRRYLCDIADQVDFDVNAPVIDPETAGWIAKDDARGVYYYNATLAAGATTAQALFDQVSIKDVESVYPFDIIVTAYAVQAEGVDTFDEAKAALDELIAG